MISERDLPSERELINGVYADVLLAAFVLLPIGFEAFTIKSLPIIDPLHGQKPETHPRDLCTCHRYDH